MEATVLCLQCCRGPMELPIRCPVPLLDLSRRVAWNGPTVPPPPFLAHLTADVLCMCHAEQLPAYPPYLGARSSKPLPAPQYHT